MRANSERIKDKNVRLFNGTPLYYYVSDTLIDCKIFEYVIIDTNVEEIKIEAPHEFPQIKIIDRPEKLTAGEISMNDVLHHSLKQVDSEFILQTHSTNPLLRKNTILDAIEKFYSNYYFRGNGRT